MAGCAVTDLDAPPSLLDTRASVTQGRRRCEDLEHARIKQVLSEGVKGTGRDDEEERRGRTKRNAQGRPKGTWRKDERQPREKTKSAGVSKDKEEPGAREGKWVYALEEREENVLC